MDEPSLGRQPPFRWRWQDVLVYSLFFIGTVVVLQAAVFLLLRFFNRQVTDLSGVQLIVIEALRNFIQVAFIFFLVKTVHGQSIPATLRWVYNSNFSVLRMAVAGSLLALATLIISNFLPASPGAEFEKFLATTASYVLFVVFGIALAPLCEEIIFRGFLFSALADTSGPKMAIWVTTVAFTLLHIPQRTDDLASLPLIFAASLVFTLVRHRSGSLVPSVVMHVVYNGIILGISALATLGRSAL